MYLGKGPVGGAGGDLSLESSRSSTFLLRYSDNSSRDIPATAITVLLQGSIMRDKIYHIVVA